MANALTDFLTARGYQRIPLTRSDVGHFHTEGTLNGRPVQVLVDTGASCTVVAMSVVQALGLRSELINSDAGGAGGALDQFRIEGADLRLGSLSPRVAGPIGLDFDHVNAALRAQGSAEVDVILGTDAFDAHAAIIDYPSQSLFLEVDSPRASSHLSRVSLVVRDYDEAIAFFTEKLKFRLVEDRYMPAQEKRWVVVAPPGSSTTSLVLARASTDAQRGAIGNQTGGRVAFFLTTDDFWRDYNAMKASSIEFTREPTTEAYGTVAVFKDLYGNLWDLISPATGTSATAEVG